MTGSLLGDRYDEVSEQFHPQRLKTKLPLTMIEPSTKIFYCLLFIVKTARLTKDVMNIRYHMRTLS